VDSCAVRFTGARGTQDRTTVLTMTQLLSSKGHHSRRNTVTLRSDALRKRVTQNEETKFFFSLPPSSVSRLVVTPAAKPKRGEVHVSTLAQGNIVAAPYEFVDQPGVEHYLLGEVGKADEAQKTLSITFFSDGESADYSWYDQETTNILEVNDVTAGDLFKTCGALAIGRCFFVGRNKNPAETVDPEKEYLPATVTDAETQQHQLQLLSEELRLDLSKVDVRLVQPSATDTTEPPTSPTKTGRTTRAVVTGTVITRTDAQTPVHTGIAHTANINI